MKNYLNFIDKDNLKMLKEEHKLTPDNFITSYEVVSTNFIIKYASGKIDTLNYTINLEEETLNKMAKQVVICSNLLNSIKLDYLKQDKEDIDKILLMVISIPLLFSFSYYNTINDTAILLIICNTIISIIVHNCKNKELQELNEALEDLDKNNLFLKYKDELLNNAITNNLTINNIDDLKLKDLKNKIKSLVKI